MAWSRLALSIRAKVLLIVLAGAIVPLGLIGVWLVRSAARSGEGLLRARMYTALDRAVPEIGMRWIRRRSDLLSLAEAPPQERRRAFSALAADVAFARFRDSLGRERWAFGERGGATSLVTVELTVHDRASGHVAGNLVAGLRAAALLRAEGTAAGATGAVLGAFDRATGAPLLPLPFDPTLLTQDRFRWGGEDWMVLRRALDEPPLEVVAAAPIAPFIQPFQQAARRGTVALLAVVLMCVGLAALLSGRTTRSLGRLAAAADAVSRGDLERQVEVASGDEVGRVAGAFNAMTESLRRTLAELARRESLAAVGEFAARLAHEIRNPLTAIRVDLQRVEERLPPASPARKLQERALAEVERLDRAVTGALRLARSGRVRLEPLDLRKPLQAAVDAAEPEFAARGARLEPLSPEPTIVRLRGDAGALEQLFLNLLLNAAQALAPGERGRATVSLEHDQAHVTVTVRDTGAGIPADDLPHLFEPFFSTKPMGSGLGLAIARQIVVAHAGEIEVESEPGQGTIVAVRFPVQRNGAVGHV